MNPYDIQVGQRLLYVSNDSRDKPAWLTVTKIGRKYIHTDDRQLKIDAPDLYAARDGMGYCGRCHISDDAYRCAQALDVAWSRLGLRVYRRSPPQGVTIADITQAAALLKVEMEP